jgi:hypothetical protein
MKPRVKQPKARPNQKPIAAMPLLKESAFRTLSAKVVIQPPRATSVPT